MKWLLRRILAVWLMLLVVCIAGVVAGRLDHRPNTLQALGFGMCDGEACFRGLKADTELRTARTMLPQAFEKEGSLNLPVNSAMMLDIIIYEPKTYANFPLPTQISAYDPSGTLIFPVTIGDVIAQYGAPCRINVSFSSNEEIFVFPTTLMVLAYSTHGRNDGSGGTRLNPESPVGRLYLVKAGAFGKCTDAVSETEGAWQGFTSVGIYRDRFARAFRAKQP
jgi:hypothetical protein